jgi:uncharacterized membrane-anchored protein
LITRGKTNIYGNIFAGSSVACFTPTVVKRILFESTEDQDPYTGLMDRLLIPIGVILMVVAVATMCVGISTDSGLVVAILGACIILVYTMVAICGYVVTVKPDKIAATDNDSNVNIDGLVSS